MQRTTFTFLTLCAALSACQQEVNTPAQLKVLNSTNKQQNKKLFMPVFAQELFKFTNEARGHARKCGDTFYPAAPPLEWNISLMESAQEYADDMAKHSHFGTTGPDGRTFADRIKAAGYLWEWIGENIARGYKTTAQVMKDWLAESKHCKNIMNPEFKDIGLGYAQSIDSYGHYWVQDFGNPKLTVSVN